MKNVIFYGSVALLTGGLMSLFACNDKSTEYPVEPAITFVSLSKTVFQPNFGTDPSVKEDSILVTIQFQDGDGDLGSDSKDDYTVALTNPNLPIDNVTNPQRFNIATFPQNGVGKSITGTIQVKITGLCCSLGCFDPVQPSPEQVPFKIYIKDRAGNKSNELVLPSITIPCR